MSPLELFQLDLDGRIKSSEFFADKPCFVYRPRAKESLAAVDTRVNNALAGRLKQGGKSGVALCVFMPTCEMPDADPYEPYFEMTGTIRIAENVLLNMAGGGTQYSAEEIALRLILLLRNFNSGIIGGNQCGLYNTVSCPHDAWRPVGTLEDDDNILLGDVKFVTRFVVCTSKKVAAPLIAGTADAVTITCADPAAQIYYTTDFSYPRPSLAEESAMNPNPNTATLYAGPFSVELGTAVRAAAYRDGRQPSDVALNYFSNPLATEDGDVLITQGGVILSA